MQAAIRQTIEAVSFCREVRVLSRLRSPHVVAFVGAALEPPSNCVLLTELMEGGDLKNWLSTARRPLRQRLSIALDVRCPARANRLDRILAPSHPH